MNATKQLHNLGQSLWLDNITRKLLTSGTLARYINEFSVTGLTSNPTIFEHAILNTDYYDEAIRQKTLAGKSGETLFFDLALEDLTQAADLFLTIHQNTNRIDGWVSLELSPLLANDTIGTIKAAMQLHTQAQRSNFFIKIPGTLAGISAIEESIFMGIPINVTLLFSREQYIAAAEAYMRGIERRIAAGLPPVASVASVFVSRWDVAAKNIMNNNFIGNYLGIAIATRIYRAHHDLLGSKRWQKLALSGTQPQRLLWASTGTKDPSAPDTFYIGALAAPDTINTMPEKTLLAFAKHGKIENMLSIDDDSTRKAEAIIAEFNHQGVNDRELGIQLQREGAASFATSWNNLMGCITSKSDTIMHNS